MNVQEMFTKAVEEVKMLKQPLDGGDMMTLYGLYQQATVGDVNTDQPGLLYLPERIKWEVWNLFKGTPKDEAKIAYIDWVGKLKEKYGI